MGRFEVSDTPATAADRGLLGKTGWTIRGVVNGRSWQKGSRSAGGGKTLGTRQEDLRDFYLRICICKSREYMGGGGRPNYLPMC